LARVPLNRSNLDWAANVAMVSLAGIRILKQATVAPGAGASATYTVTEKDAHRVVAFHGSTAALDIRVHQNGTATASHLPMANGVYMSFEVETDDTVSFFNTTGGAITVYLVELG
jgi:uncharacterized iron-regulated membrane protein